MKKIRRGVFETNSSSSHSISLGRATKKTQWDTLPVDKERVCTIHEGDFGWDTEEFTNPATKASYCFTYAKGDPELMLMLGEVIKEQLGDDIDVEFIDADGYIDHQSLDVAEEVFESKDTLKRFIFHPDSSLQTGNDNG